MRYVVLLLLCWVGNVSAEVEVGLGITHFQHADNGTWYQEEFPHRLQMNSPSLSLGVRRIIERPFAGFDRFAVRTGYEYLGRARSTAIATASDEDYWSCRYHTETCWPTSHWHGVGDVQGLYLTIQPEVDMTGYSLFFEAGASAYHSRWRVDIPDWRPTRDGPVQSLTASHKARWQLTYIVGLGIRRGPWSLAYTVRRAEATGDEFPAIYAHQAHNLALRYSF